MQERRGVDELDRRGEVNVMPALVAAEPRRGEVSIGRRRLPPASTRCAVTSGMRGMLRRHTGANHLVHLRQVVFQMGREPFVGFVRFWSST